jgi:hypothetical protein
MMIVVLIAVVVVILVLVVGVILVVTVILIVIVTVVLIGGVVVIYDDYDRHCRRCADGDGDSHGHVIDFSNVTV